MATKEELNEAGRRLAAQIKSIDDDATLTGAQKSERLDAIRPDWEAHVKSVEASESASAMAAKLGLGGGDSVTDAVTSKSMSLVRSESPWANRGADLALEAVDSKEISDNLMNSLKSKSKFDIGLELGLKDSTASNNLMGEFLYGQTGPTPVGQNPFGQGAFAPGIIPTFLPGIVEKLFYELTLADIITEFPVTTPTISYLTESVANMNAQAVAESGTYPFSSEEVARAYAQVGKVANAMTISDEAVQDAPTLWNFAQGRLLQGVQRREELEILAGAGLPGVGGLLSTFAGQFSASQTASLFGQTATTANVTFPPNGTNGTGVQPTTINNLSYGRVVTGTTTGQYPTATAIAENLLDAFTDIQLQIFKTPNVLVMHPRDWVTLRLAKDAQGQYFNSSFFGQEYGNAHGVVKSLWGTPVVTTPLIPQHTILTGYFDASTVQIARRKGVTMQMTNTNGTDFVQGNITARAESRLGLLCYRPSAFQLVSLKPGP